jgi:hypothetical protein
LFIVLSAAWSNPRGGFAFRQPPGADLTGADLHTAGTKTPALTIKTSQ